MGDAFGLDALTGKNANLTPGKIASHTAVGAARLFASAATRSAITGSSFGDAVEAGPPDVIGQVVGSVLGTSISDPAVRARRAEVDRIVANGFNPQDYGPIDLPTEQVEGDPVATPEATVCEEAREGVAGEGPVTSSERFLFARSNSVGAQRGPGLNGPAFDKWLEKYLWVPDGEPIVVTASKEDKEAIQRLSDQEYRSLLKEHGDSGLVDAARELFRRVGRLYELGSLSSSFETRDENPGTYSTGKGDAGGVSYGPWQMASNRGTPEEFLRSKESAIWAKNFTGLKSGTKEFTEAWVSVAESDRSQFYSSQQRFITRKYLDELIEKLDRNFGIDFSQSSSTIQNVLLSRAVQHGLNLRFFKAAIDKTQGEVTGNEGVYDFSWEKRFIDNIYAESGRKDAQGRLVYFKSSPTLWKGLSARFTREAAKAQRWLIEERKP